jgi:hypothetical protein
MRIAENLIAIAPLLSDKWVGGGKPNEIMGFWAEDGSSYTITAPPQLVPFLLKVQNGLYEQNKRFSNMWCSAEEINHQFRNVFK